MPAVEPLVYAWPESAKFGRVVPKSRIYAHTKVSARTRERFVSEVQRIVWSHKLAEVTIGLPGTDDVPEIDVFSVETKHGALADDVLIAIDRAVPQALLFEVVDRSGDVARVRTAAVYAHRTAQSTTRRVYSTGWCSANGPRARLPQAIDLAGLYAGLVTPLLPIAGATGERLEDAAGRAERARRLERQIARDERKMRSEVQFNRKVELRRRIRARQQELDMLQAPSSPEFDDEREHSWTS